MSAGARRAAALGLACLILLGAVVRTARLHLASATIAATRWPYFPGSILRLRVDGITGPYHVTVLGPGTFTAPDTYEIPPGTARGSALLVAGNGAGLGSMRLRIGSAPHLNQPLLLVAAYDDGLVIHDARTFGVVGVLATGGVPSDVAVAPTGTAAVTDTQGSQLTVLRLSPWSVSRLSGIATGDDVAVDAPLRAFFVTDRDVNGAGALTRVGFDGRISRVVTGDTAEGLAIDTRRQIVYVANVNDGTIAFVDARSLRVLRRMYAVERVFSLALSPDGRELYAVSNEAAQSPLGRPGRIVALALGRRPRVVARSGPLTFPAGIALDASRATLFVSDEASRELYVLDARTLRAKHEPLPTCAIPWKLTLDTANDRLYVPCAGDNKIDVFSARTFDRTHGAPFTTGGYPLAIAVWKGKLHQ